MPRIVIKATKFSRSKEADEVFESRGWKIVYDQTVIPKKRKLVNSDKYDTPLINLISEEYEYE